MTRKTGPIRVRMAPSPTGPLHVGTARTALFNWLFARHEGGTFILRIEDTDKDRSKKEYEDGLIEGLLWLGIEWNEGPMPGGKEKGKFGPYRQSERTDIYKKYLERLIAERKAYYCYCTKEELEAERQAMMAQGQPPKYGGHCRDLKTTPKGKEPQIIRFKTPETMVEFKDLIRGTVSFDASLFGDLAIARNLEEPLYNFAVVVDDAEMQITHVIRGEDHLPNTPKQILFLRALGFAEPTYAHIPLILSADRSKMSKRYAETSLLDYRERGYLPNAMVNFLGLLGWHPTDEQEVFSPNALIAAFDLKRVQKAGAVFDPKKLDWIEKKHFDLLSTEDIFESVASLLKERGIKPAKPLLMKVVQLERERVKTIEELANAAGFFFALPEYDAKLLLWQGQKPQDARHILEDIQKALQTADRLNQDDLQELLAPFVEEKGRGAVYWPLRAALSGLTASPDPLRIAEVLGKNEVLARIGIALEKLRT